MRLLLVDDSKTARRMLMRIFNELGSWDIVEAENGQDALDKLEKIDSIDLACIDWNMPVMNGLEFLKVVKKIPEFADAWFMMVTSETEMDNISKAMVSGAHEYVMKPYTKEIIIAKLEVMGFLN